MARAADRAYGSVREPGRGHDPHRRARDGRTASPARSRTCRRRRGCGATATQEQQNALIANVLEGALDAGRGSRSSAAPTCCRCCARPASSTPAATALSIIFAGVIAALRGAEPPPLEHHAPGARHASRSTSPRRYRFCTNFAVKGDELDGTDLIPLLEELGDSVLVVGERTTLKVHVHTDDPERATALFAERRRGLPPRRRRHARAGRRSAAERLAAAGAERCAALAVVSGDGMRGAVRERRRVRARRRARR